MRYAGLESSLRKDFLESGGIGSMSSEPSRKDVAQSLEVIGKHVSAKPAEAPARFVIELAQRWKGRGGLLAGKPRHSDRYLDELLRRLGTPIRSLTPKLAGRTQIRPSEAEDLIRLFLSHWDYVGDPHSGDIGPRSADRYRPLLTEAEIDDVCAYVADRMVEAGPEGRAPAEVTMQAVPGQDMPGLIASQFKDASAYFQIGAGQTVLVAQPETILLGFRDLMDRLWTIDAADGQERMMIWTLDLGRQDFEDLESRLRFMNVMALLERFKALKRFKERRSEERWDWLQSRAVIVLHDTSAGRPAGTRLPAFDPHHVLFSAIPPAWAGSRAFHTLYGTDRLHKTNYSIFLRRVGEAPVGRTDPQRFEFHYFGHALLNEDKGDPQPRALRLNSPGRSYVEALGTVFEAAGRKLGLRNFPRHLSVDGMRIDSDHATEKLQHHGFHLLRLEEFMTF